MVGGQFYTGTSRPQETSPKIGFNRIVRDRPYTLVRRVALFPFDFFSQKSFFFSSEAQNSHAMYQV